MTSGYWTGQQFFLALEKNPDWGVILSMVFCLEYAHPEPRLSDTRKVGWRM